MRNPIDRRLPLPPQSGGLVVWVGVRRYAGRAVGIWATVKDPAGHSIAAICSGTAGSQALRAQRTWSHGTPAVWMVRVRAGAFIALSAAAADGRRGRGTATVAPRLPQSLRGRKG